MQSFFYIFGFHQDLLLLLIGGFVYFSWIIEIIEESYYEKNSVLRGQQEFFEDEISHYAESLKIIRYTIYGKIKAIIEEQKPKLIWKFN